MPTDPIADALGLSEEKQEESDQESLRKRVMGDKSPLEYLHHATTTNPKSPMYRPKRKNAHPERDLQNAVIQWLTLHKVCHVRLDVKPPTYFAGGHLIRTSSPLKGWPDLMIFIQGRAYGCELKVDSRQSDGQKEIEKYLNEVGKCPYWIVRSLDDLERLIKPLLAVFGGG